MRRRIITGILVMCFAFCVTLIVVPILDKLLANPTISTQAGRGCAPADNTNRPIPADSCPKSPGIWELRCEVDTVYAEMTALKGPYLDDVPSALRYLWDDLYKRTIDTTCVWQREQDTWGNCAVTKTRIPHRDPTLRCGYDWHWRLKR